MTSDISWPEWRKGEPLESLEDKMLQNAKAGEPTEHDGPYKPADMQAWGQERMVRAAVLRHLLITEEWPVDAQGIRLRGVRISGLLDLKAATLRCPLSLDNCYLDASEPACFDHATASSVTLSGCWLLAGLTGEMLTAEDLALGGSILTGPLRLEGASLTGGLRCGGARLFTHNKHGYALSAEGIKVGGDVYLDEGFTAEGAVRLAGADITGRLRCSGATLTGRDKNGNALSASGVKVGGGVFLDREFTAYGAVRLAGADITGELSCRGAQLIRRDKHGNALSARGVKVGGDVFLSREFTAADGAVRLAGADITGRLRCSSAQLTGCDNDGNALSARGIKVGDDVQLDEGFAAAGAVRLAGADITGTLRCNGARLTGRDKNGNALHGEMMKVGGDVHFDNAFITSGAICLLNADIAEDFCCSGAQLTGRDKDDNALHGDGIKVGGDVRLNDGFIARGEISLTSAHAGALRWAPGEQVRWRVDLEGADVAQLEDAWTGPDGSERPNGHWPTEGQLRLDGFSYSRLGGAQQPTVGQRLGWIRSQYTPKPTVRWTNGIMAPPVIAAPRMSAAAKGAPNFVPGPYEQLAAVYRQAGQDSEAREVAIARRADLRKNVKLNPYRWAGNWFLGWSIGYGYKTWRAAVGLAIVFVAFLVLSWWGQNHHLLVPVGKATAPVGKNIKELDQVPSATKCTSSYPCFQPFGYAVDTVIPIIKVGQAQYWRPDGNAPGGQAFVASTWIATGFGWALVTLLVTGYTGLVRRE